jgi:hypothetical protein
MFPGVFWKKHFSSGTQWWSYDGIWDGLKIHIYAIKEAPPTCTAIIETRKVKKQVPVAFEEREVEETVVIGWDCGGESEVNHES